MKERTRARGWAVQALYAWESRGGGADKLLPVFQDLVEEMRVSPRNRFYADALLRVVARNLSAIDEVIQRHLTNWSLARLSAIDRNILRLGVAELLYLDDVPPKVTMREMVRLAERYGTEESPRFVNGVLDAVMHEVDAGGSALT